MSTLKKAILVVAFVLIVVLAAAVALVAYLSVTEYSPALVEAVNASGSGPYLSMEKPLTVATFNIGYGGLGAGSDFFMDGGSQVQPESEAVVRENLSGITATLSGIGADIHCLQEVDLDSRRSYGIDETAALAQALAVKPGPYARNYKCAFVPFPWPPIGKIDSGLLTLSTHAIDKAQRHSLPVPFSWPVRIANLKRCLLASYLPIEGTDRQLVIVNLHMEAYDDTGGKEAQTQVLLDLMQAEYEKGNYVIAAGDFNQTFPGAAYPQLYDDWAPGSLEGLALPDGYQLATDAASPTCRLLNRPYDGNRQDTQLFVIDGFLVSPNVEILDCATVDADFAHSDHNPVVLTVRLNDP